jgi:Protein of unknown function (DUF1616)
MSPGPTGSAPEATRAPVSAGSESRFYDPRVLIVVALVLAAYIVLTVLPWTPVTAVLGAVVLLLAPGYGVGALLFRGARRFVPPAANLALVVGLSVVYNGLVGILLLLVGPGLSALPLALAALPPVVLGAVAHSWRGAPTTWTSLPQQLAAPFRLPGFSSGQRRLIGVLLVGSVVAFGAIAYEATVVPPAGPSLSLAVTGPDGTTSTLPSSGTTNHTFAVLLTLGSTTEVSSAELTVGVSLLGSPPATNATVPWSMPLVLGAGVTSSENLTLGAGATISVAVSYTFPHAGSYTVTFTLHDRSGLRSATTQLSETIR